ncbi:unnamed protein product [Lactuca saligna]|uniref:Uncharacterized protein n=1 Tax=Lactuca saligna TaxID=75948 RepID=A0AA35ZPA8_LACSI|nr:unnamed protein product [Lactuca saligna]
MPPSISSTDTKRYLKGGGDRRCSDVGQSLVFTATHKELDEEFINEIDEAGDVGPGRVSDGSSSGSDDTELRSKFRAMAPTLGSITRMVMGGCSRRKSCE